LQEEISEEQAGFRCKEKHTTKYESPNHSGESTIMETTLCFIDFTKAFDMVQHDKLWFSMPDMGFPPHLVQLLRNLYKQQSAAVKVAGTLSESFSVKKGVWQAVMFPHACLTF